MKHFFLTILKWKLKKLAQWTIARYRPGVIGVTGSVGKTSTKQAIATVLGADRSVRFSKGNFNNELGLPLTVLGDWDEVGGLFFWLKVLITGFKNIIMRVSYPEILVLEYAIDRPGDMKRLLDIVRPNIGIVTAIGEIPVHVEFFGGSDDVAREKGRLIEYLPSAGFAVLNHDDESVMSLKGRTRAHLVTFGFGRDAEVRITNFETRVNGMRPIGISFKLSYGGATVPIKIEHVYGKAQAYAAAAGAAVGIIFGMNLVRIAAMLAAYRASPGRMEFKEGKKGVFILDDSYNASPLSMHAALDTLSSLPAKRRIAVLGDMRELGAYSTEAHEFIGRIAAETADEIITVGPHAKILAESAGKKRRSKKHIHICENADEAARMVREMVKPGDLVLVKGSHAMRLDKVVEEIKAI